MERSPAGCPHCPFYRPGDRLDPWCKVKPGMKVHNDNSFPEGCPLPVTVKKLTRAEKEFYAELINDGK